MMRVWDKKFNSGFTPLETIGRQRRDLVSLTGFTLVEVILAAAILVIALLGILALYVNCAELASTGRNLTYATNAIQLQIEAIRDHSFFDIEADFDGQPFAVAEILPGNSMGVIYVDDLGGDILQVTISVCWRQRGNRIIGEDLNLNGVEDAGEGDGDGIIESPAEIVTLITPR